ncbi:hypothetical protein LJC71_04835 [Desulfosarcina sp. OttesenSCG-928-A07]|nr:hypothetical protein [Desulfosarcina sp. OttesenSCG-928-G17]MDL2329063.1 hypothetical protein [Desulfosarcina sp. OttesenSCG-928-A07]
MTQQTTLANMRSDNNTLPAAIAGSTTAIGMNTVGGFESLQRVAKVFASSSIVPKQFQGNLPDCVIAVDMAIRMGANPLMVCQNLYVVYGRPAWSAKFLIATLNQCGRFSAIRYVFQGKQGSDDWGCRAVATELSTNEKLEGPLITIGLAKEEGWYGKNGSKWKTMPELMLRYRAAAWFVNAYAPEIAMGLRTAEEEIDSVYDVHPGDDGAYQITTADIRRNDTKPVEKEPEPPVEPDKKTSTKRKPQTIPPTKTEAPPTPPPDEHEPEYTDEFSGQVIYCERKKKDVDEMECLSCDDRESCRVWG